MIGTIETTTVEGRTYKYWADFDRRCEYAEDEEGNRKVIRSNGYIHKDLTVRKAIAAAFRHDTFRK